MKRTLSRTRLARLNSFTLVELLVVMGIIAILASILIVAAGSAINAAKRARAATIENQIQTAVLNYYTEYSVYPLPAATTTDVTYSTNFSGDGANWENLMYALCGNINPYTGAAATSTVANTRAIAYLSPRKTDVDANGILMNPISPVGYTNYFNIAIDGNYDGILGNTAPLTASIPNLNIASMPYTNVVNAGCILWVNCNPNASTTNNNFWVRSGF